MFKNIHIYKKHFFPPSIEKCSYDGRGVMKCLKIYYPIKILIFTILNIIRESYNIFKYD